MDALLALLNSTPVVDGVPTDAWADDTAAEEWAREHGGGGARAGDLRRIRDRLQAVARGAADPSVLVDALDGVHQVPRLDHEGVTWALVGADLPARMVLAWAAVQEAFPGRLRPCGNDECRLFLLDRSRANRARWCSMATCGNRLKARRHHQRAQAREA
ncbi:CGNR zinc finger domain-containing protein [Umezawaea sp.]|uniref:CGNR zinc finger domain-containing protein n=1 Tax=Umezawaea sp. TaxID=1955258 RepID=UPI002ED46600